MPANSPNFGVALRILCADDVSQIAGVVQDALQMEGHRVTCVGDGRAAYELITTAPPREFDVLITDHQMPEWSGLALVTKLRATGFSGVIVVHSSDLSDAERAAYRGLAVDHIFTKPGGFSDLIAAIREISRKGA